MRPRCHVLHIGRGRSVLRAAGGPVDLDRHPLGVARDSTSSSAVSGPVSGNSGVPWPTTIGEGEHFDLVDQVVVEQQPDQGAAAVRLQLASRLGLQLADGGRELPGEHVRVRPPRDRTDAPISSAVAHPCCSFMLCLPRTRPRTSAMSYSATDAESIAAPCSLLGPLLRKVSTAACDSQRSKMLTRPAVPRGACSTTLTQPASKTRAAGAGHGQTWQAARVPRLARHHGRSPGADRSVLLPSSARAVSWYPPSCRHGLSVSRRSVAGRVSEHLRGQPLSTRVSVVAPCRWKQQRCSIFRYVHLEMVSQVSPDVRWHHDAASFAGFGCVDPATVSMSHRAADRDQRTVRINVLAAQYGASSPVARHSCLQRRDGSFRNLPQIRRVGLPGMVVPFVRGVSPVVQ